MLKKGNISAFLFLAAVFVNIQACSDQKENETSKEECVSIFNGRDLTGWDIKIKDHPLNENYKNTFRIEDNMIRVSYSDYQKFNNKFGHLFTQAPYSYYKLKLEYRFVSNHVADAPEHCIENSGIMLHSQSAKSMELHQDFPVSLSIKAIIFKIRPPFNSQIILRPISKLLNGARKKDFILSRTEVLRRTDVSGHSTTHNEKQQF